MAIVHGGPRRQHDPKTLKLAVNNVRMGKMSQRKAAEIYGIPQTTISNYITGRTVFALDDYLDLISEAL